MIAERDHSAFYSSLFPQDPFRLGFREEGRQVCCKLRVQPRDTAHTGNKRVNPALLRGDLPPGATIRRRFGPFRSAQGPEGQPIGVQRRSQELFNQGRLRPVQLGGGEDAAISSRVKKPQRRALPRLYSSRSAESRGLSLSAMG